MTGNTCGGAKNQPINENIEFACGANGELMVDDQCTQCDPRVQAGNEIEICNGNNMNTNNYCETIQNILRRDEAAGPQAFEVRIPVVESGLDPSNCNTFQFSGNDNLIISFATLQIFGAVCGNNQDPTMYVDPSVATNCSSPPSGNYIAARLLCNEESGELGGGLPNATDSRPRLVR